VKINLKTTFGILIPLIIIFLFNYLVYDYGLRDLQKIHAILQDSHQSDGCVLTDGWYMIFFYLIPILTVLLVFNKQLRKESWIYFVIIIILAILILILFGILIFLENRLNLSNFSFSSCDQRLIVHVYSIILFLGSEIIIVAVLRFYPEYYKIDSL
jgi:hypothetical protein